VGGVSSTQDRAVDAQAQSLGGRHRARRVRVLLMRLAKPTGEPRDTRTLRHKGQHPSATRVVRQAVAPSTVGAVQQSQILQDCLDDRRRPSRNWNRASKRSVTDDYPIFPHVTCLTFKTANICNCTKATT